MGPAGVLAQDEHAQKGQDSARHSGRKVGWQKHKDKKKETPVRTRTRTHWDQNRNQNQDLDGDRDKNRRRMTENNPELRNSRKPQVRATNQDWLRRNRTGVQTNRRDQLQKSQIPSQARGNEWLRQHDARRNSEWLRRTGSQKKKQDWLRRDRDRNRDWLRHDSVHMHNAFHYHRTDSGRVYGHSHRHNHRTHHKWQDWMLRRGYTMGDLRNMAKRGGHWSPSPHRIGHKRVPRKH